jgi:uncharacterized protein
MQIAIISDIHNNETNLKKVLDYCVSNKISKVICCGDLASLETLDFLNDNFAGEIFYTFGNMDNDFLRNYPFKDNRYRKTKIFKDFGETKIDGKHVAFIHFPQEAKKLCELGKYNFVFYGHTHKPFEEIISNCKMLNPGNIANQLYLPTFAVWETENDKFSLIRVNEIK